MTAKQQQALDALRSAALGAFTAGVPWQEALNALKDAHHGAKQTAKSTRPGRIREGCPSEAAYRRHLKAGEECAACSDFMRGVEAERKGRHPEWRLSSRSRPVAAAADSQAARPAGPKPRSAGSSDHRHILARSSGDMSEARARARTYLTRTGNTDVAEILGLLEAGAR